MMMMMMMMRERKKRKREERRRKNSIECHRFFFSFSTPNQRPTNQISPARLPGGPLAASASANLGWHALTGALDEFDVGSYLGAGAGVPGQESEELPPDLHSQAEALFKLGTKPARRAT